MAHGVNFRDEPSPLLAMVRFLNDRLEIANDRLKQDLYVPIATETMGVCETAIGTYFLARACLERLYSCSRGQRIDHVNLFGLNYIDMSKECVIEGLSKITYLPRAAVREAWQLGQRSIQVLSTR